MRPGRQRPSLGVALLVMQMMNYGVNRFPPVTLATIAAQVAIYLRLLPVPWTTASACLSARKILWEGDYWRLLFSVLEHADDLHLYYNMTSFMIKARSLELDMGSRRFATLLSVFTAACGAVYVALAMIAAEIEDPSYIDQCSVGFSGVIFALKVLTTTNSPSYVTIIPGINIPMKWAVWVELLLIQMLTPNASFIGHLAGIIVGLAYVYGPLRYIVDLLDGFISEPNNRFNRGRRRGRTPVEGDGPDFGGPGDIYNMPGVSEEEQMAEALRRSRQDRGGGADNFWSAWNQAEDAEMQRAMYESMRQQQAQQQRPSTGAGSTRPRDEQRPTSAPLPQPDVFDPAFVRSRRQQHFQRR